MTIFTLMKRLLIILTFWFIFFVSVHNVSLHFCIMDSWWPSNACWSYFFRHCIFWDGKNTHLNLQKPFAIWGPRQIQSNQVKGAFHGLWTPNEGINQRYLKNWADVADKICCRHTYKFGSGSEFSAVQWRLFPLWASVVRGLLHDQVKYSRLWWDLYVLLYDDATILERCFLLIISKQKNWWALIFLIFLKMERNQK